MGPEPSSIIAPEDEPFVDLVQIRAVGQFGTGLLVGRGIVLTALHCACDPKFGWRPREGLGVYTFRDLKRGVEKHFDAEVVWPSSFELGKHLPDVAVLRINDDDPPSSLVRHRFGEMPNVASEGSARGFPKSTEGPELPGGRVEHDQPGRVHYTSLTRRALTIDAIGRHQVEGRERWSGLSGGPLLANGFIVGVMREVRDAWKGEAIEAEPLAPLLRGCNSLRSLLGVEWPLHDTSDRVQTTLLKAYDVIGTAAYGASRRTLDAVAAQPFYGRVKDLAALDRAFAEHDRGVSLLRGAAGLGKSRLAVRWADLLAAAADRRTQVLRHAFSVREPAAGTAAAMVASLVRQAADELGPQALGGGEPGDPMRLADRFATLLTTDRYEGTRLVVVLDALDEAAEAIELAEAGLGRGVFLLATCRAEDGEEPPVLHPWRDRVVRSGTLILDHFLPPLDKEAVATWLANATGRKIAPEAPLVARTMRASEGVPLFIHYLVPDAIEALEADLADPFPASFSLYAQQQLRGLRDRLKAGSRPWTWREVLELLAVLAVAVTPLPAAALRQLGLPEALDALDPRAERWLWRRAETRRGEGGVSLTHPRLAAVFRAALPELEPEVVTEAEERLIDKCAAAWSVKGRNPLKRYALMYLPDHLAAAGRLMEAARLLGDFAFLLARFQAEPTTATVHATATGTIRLDRRIGDRDPLLAEWRHFWSETEAHLAAAITRSTQLGLTTEGVFLQLAQDWFGTKFPELDEMRGEVQSWPHLARGCRVRFPALLRSMDRAHLGGVSSILALADRLVSWGMTDGAIRVWTLDGSLLSGEVSAAHLSGIPRSVGGVLALPNRLVSWGIMDGAIRLWTLEGNPLLGGDTRAHQGGVRGMLALPDRLVSWGMMDGAIRFWTLDGNPLNGGDREAHPGGVCGMLALSDRLISWGAMDGVMRFWTLEGKPLNRRRRTQANAMAGEIEGVLALSDRLVSWGQTSRAIQLWTLDGRPRGRRQSDSDFGAIAGVLALRDRLVSWGGHEDGAIRFWTFDGKVLPGGDLDAHQFGVGGILVLRDHLVSWGSSDGAIRFWTLDGKPASNGDPAAHADGVAGMVALSDRLVSWGCMDGAIRFWTIDGKPQHGGDPEAHRVVVGGVLALRDRLVSWGEDDGAIRLWTLDGRPSLGGTEAHRGGIGSILALEDRLITSGREDGAIRLWTLDGNPLSENVAAHRGRLPGAIGGVLALPDRFVSWGYDGAVRFWTLDANPEIGGDLCAHDGGVGGMLVLPQQLISWGEKDGKIRFWSLDGKPLSGTDYQAHDGGVWGVLALPDRLVSWAEADGATRFWALDGGPVCDGNPEAHRGMVLGKHSDMLALPDRLVSWHADGAIRLWSLEGKQLTGGDSAAHPGGVWGMLALADGLVSWGGDGAIRFWTLDGKLRRGGDAEAHPGGVYGVLTLPDMLVSWGRKDGVLRTWSFDGTFTEKAWIAPALLDCVATNQGQVFIGMNGRPHRLFIA